MDERFLEGKKTYNRNGIFLSIMSVVAVILQFVMMGIVNVTGLTYDWMNYMIILIPIHIVGLGMLICMFKSSDKKLAAQGNPSKIAIEGDGKNVKAVEVLSWILITFGLGGVFAIVGNLINIGIYSIIGVDPTLGNVSNQIVGTSSTVLTNVITVLVVGVTGPIAEELIFRKMLIDHTAKYGVRKAIMMSAFFFGLYHGNLSQFFMAFVMGLVLGQVYVKTGKIIYTIICHMAINCYNSAMTLTQSEVLSVLYFVMLVAGLVVAIIFIVRDVNAKKEASIEAANDAEDSETEKVKEPHFEFANLGTILFLVYSLAMFAYSYLSIIIAHAQGIL